MNRLGRDDGASLVALIASRARITDALARKIAEKTDGIPLFVEELTKGLLESGGLAVGEGGRGAEEAFLALDVPNTLHDSLMARLDRLGPVKEIAQIAAVLGREFAYTSLASLSGFKGTALDAGLARLVETGLLARLAASGSGAFYFRHALIRDVAYDNLLLARRKSLHAKAAALLRASDPENHMLLASHLERAESWADAFHQFRLAGESAVRGYADVRGGTPVRAGTSDAGAGRARSRRRTGRCLVLRAAADVPIRTRSLRGVVRASKPDARARAATWRCVGRGVSPSRDGKREDVGGGFRRRARLRCRGQGGCRAGGRPRDQTQVE